MHPFGTVACAWYRQVRLLGIVVRLSPHHKPSRFALGRRSQAHVTKKTTRIKRKTNWIVFASGNIAGVTFAVALFCSVAIVIVLTLGADKLAVHFAAFHYATSSKSSRWTCSNMAPYSKYSLPFLSVRRS